MKKYIARIGLILLGSIFIYGLIKNGIWELFVGAFLALLFIACLGWCIANL